MQASRIGEHLDAAEHVGHRVGDLLVPMQLEFIANVPSRVGASAVRVVDEPPSAVPTRQARNPRSRSRRSSNPGALGAESARVNSVGTG